MSFMQLKIHVPESEYIIDPTNEIIQCPSIDILIEHSLYTISRWESIWHKPYLVEEKKTNEEMMSYIKCMIVSPEDINEFDINRVIQNEDNIKKIADFMNNSMTATTIKETEKGKRSSSFLSSELLYYWISELNINFDSVEHWHINRLLMLLRLASEEQKPKKKKTMNETLNDYSRLNEMRRKKYNTKG